MVTKVGNCSGLINRVASNCFAQPLARCNGRLIEDRHEIQDHEEDIAEMNLGERLAVDQCDDDTDDPAEHERLSIWEEEEEKRPSGSSGTASALLERVRQMESMMAEVFQSVSALKRSYASLQEAHSPWDPDRIRVADAAVVDELRSLGRLRDRYRRGGLGANYYVKPTTPSLKEAVAPYEAALDELRRDLKAKDAELESLKGKLRHSSTTTTTSGSRKTKARSLKRVFYTTSLAGQSSPTAELFEACMEQVRSASKSFTANLLSLMRAARWDITAAARSIVEGDSSDGVPLVLEPQHAKYALESYVCRRIFHGFENETFYIEGTLASLLQPSEHRRNCFAQFRDMRGMDPAELLGILPTCQFGRFAAKKYLSIVHPRMEESLFGGLDQRRQVVAGTHPRTGFYGEFLRLAKAVWLLHLLAFALEPPPRHFEASRGADFHPEYMESVAKFAGAGGRVPAGWVVAFSVCPGFKLGNGAVVRARVYVVQPKGP